MRFQKLKSESGQGLTEYAVVLSLVAVLAIVSVSLFGGALKSRVGMLTGAVLGKTEVITSANTAAGNVVTGVNANVSKNQGMALSDGKEMVGAMSDTANAGGTPPSP